MQTHTNDTPIELMDTFSMPETELRIVAEYFLPEFAFDIDKVKRDIGLWLTKAAGLPCGEDHQQPYDFVRMFSMSLSPDMYETHEEFEWVVFLFYLWAFRSHQILKSETFGDAISQTDPTNQLCENSEVQKERGCSREQQLGLVRLAATNHLPKEPLCLPGAQTDRHGFPHGGSGMLDILVYDYADRMSK